MKKYSKSRFRSVCLMCVSRELFGEAIFFVDEKNSHTVSPAYASFYQTYYGGWIFECNCLLLLSIVYERKLSNRLTAVILKDFRLENIECSKYHLIFWTTQEVLSKPFLSWLKKYLPHCFTHQLYVCLFSVFNLTHFDWLPAHCLLSFTPEN